VVITFTGNDPTVLRQIEATTHWKMECAEAFYGHATHTIAKKKAAG